MIKFKAGLAPIVLFILLSLFLCLTRESLPVVMGIGGIIVAWGIIRGIYKHVFIDQKWTWLVIAI